MNVFRGLLGFFALLLAGCAIQVAPGGGERDTNPPKLISATPSMYATNFTAKQVTMVFDEYISLKDLQANLVVSPPMKIPLQVRVRGRQLNILITDTLLSNTTYTINFSNALVDLNEGNPLPDFQYVFSTGEIIDTLKVTGKVKDALTHKTEKGITVMLYRDDSDSLLYQTLPSWFARTGEDGSFEIRNVSPGSYSIAAIKDANANYRYDGESEALGFMSEKIKAGDQDIRLSLFKETPPFRLVRASSEIPGRATLRFSSAAFDPSIKWLSDTTIAQLFKIVETNGRDSLLIWYRNRMADSLSFILSEKNYSDTINLVLRKSSGSMKSKTDTTLKTQYAPGLIHEMVPQQPVVLKFNFPVEHFDPDLISVMLDSTTSLPAPVTFSDETKQVLRFEFNTGENQLYSVRLLPGAIKDIFGTTNDTLLIRLKTRSLTEFGSITLQLKAPETKSDFILQLIDEKETVYRETFFRNDTIVFFSLLEPRNYKLRIIQDRNNNGKWDTGNYLLKMQPESVFYFKDPVTIRANWDVELTWPGFTAE